ncbi:MAG: HAMP domain-containing protein [Nitrospirae bacterium]|nr:HAMP domain-containing protein [Nitrospirota bacterium]
MSIKNRIIYFSIFLLALFIAMAIGNWFGNRSVTVKGDLAYLLQKETMHLQGIFRGINEFIIDEGEPLSRQLTQEHIKGFEDLHAVVLTKFSGRDSKLRKVMDEKIAPQWKKVKEGTETFLKIKLIKVTNDDAMLQYGQLTTEARALYKEVEALSQRSQEDAKAAAKKVGMIISAVATATLIVVCFILFNLYRSITSPIKELSTIAEGFGRGDLSIVMNESKEDEFGKLAYNFNQAMNRLSEFISRLKKDINTAASSIEKFSEDCAIIANNAQNQSAQTSDAASATTQLSVTFNEIAQTIEGVSNSAKDASALAVQSGDIVNHAINSMNTIHDAVKKAAAIVESLARKTTQIGEILKVISEIADQTNLLALNANIEAARAGEQGRGFAVVADEVRKLAERTTVATQEIAEMIKGIKKNTNDAVESMQICTKEVAAGSDMSSKTGSSLQQIVVSAQNVSNIIQRIAVSVEEQSHAATEINSNLTSVSDIAQHTNDSAQRSFESSQSLHKLATELQTIANEFKLRNGIPDYT